MKPFAPLDLGSHIHRKKRDTDMFDRISVSSAIHFGKPCVAGTRIPVQSVLELIEEGVSFSAIVTDYYPELEIEDVQACLRYAIALVAAEEIDLAGIGS